MGRTPCASGSELRWVLAASFSLRVPPPAHRLRIASALAIGCAAVEHGYKAQQYAGVPLAPTKGRGGERWKAELQLDETLAGYVAEHGRPDYFYIVDRQKLYLFYTGTDKAAMFERILMEPSHVTELGRIPGSLLKLLPAADAATGRGAPGLLAAPRAGQDAPRARADRAQRAAPCAQLRRGASRRAGTTSADSR